MPDLSPSHPEPPRTASDAAVPPGAAKSRGPMRVAEFAAGTGQLSVAAECAGAEVVLLWEIAPAQRRVLRPLHPRAELRREVADQHNLERFAPLAILMGGPPCQGTSSANPNRAGLADYRAGVLGQALKTIPRTELKLELGDRTMRSQLVLLEYVPNILRRQDVFGEWVRLLREVYDYEVQCFLLHACNHGDPTTRQRRQRGWVQQGIARW